MNTNRTTTRTRSLRRPGTWVTKDQRVLLISEMETDHLSNTINMLRRRGFVPKGTRGPMPLPPNANTMGEFAYEAASESWQHDIAAWLSSPPEHPALNELEAELKRRLS